MFSSIIAFLFLSAYPASAKANGKCAEWVKLAALDWAKEVLESDVETTKQISSEPFSIEFALPILQDIKKNPPRVSEVYSIDWRIRFKDQDWQKTGFYFFDDKCHRMKTAEYNAGKEADRHKK